MIRFIIPAYNEELNIDELLENTSQFCLLNNYDYQIIVINDGSTDETMRILKKFEKRISLIVLDQVVNKGVGAAFRRGFAYVVDNGSEQDIIVTKEADNTSDLSVLNKMLDNINNGYDLVLASCYMKGGSVEKTNLYRKILSSGANYLIKMFTPLKGVNTFSSFYRVYRLSMLKRAWKIYGEKLIEEAGFTCMAELLLKFAYMNIRMTEVPMILKGDMRKGKSKMKTLSTIGAYIKLLFKFHFAKRS